MAVMPTEDDLLTKILNFMVDDFGLQPGGQMESNSFFALVDREGWTNEMFEAGLDAGFKTGRLELPLPGTVKLTTAGFEKAHTDTE